MQPVDFIIFLQDSKRRFWNINAAGEVILSANPYPIVFSPDGWDDILIKNIRNKKYWSLFRTVTTPFKFVEDAAKILKHIYYTQGTEASVYLVICELRLHYVPGVEYGFWYKQIFRSEIDSSTFQHDGPFVTASCAEDGFAKHLKSNENTVFEIPLDDSNSIMVKEDGILLKEKAEYLFLEGFDFVKSNTGSRFIIPLSFVGKESETSPVTFTDSPLQDVSGMAFDDLVKSSYYFAELPPEAGALFTPIPVSVQIKGTIKILATQNDPGAAFTIRFLKTGQTVVNQTDYNIITSSPLVVGTTYEFPVDIIIPLNPADQAYLQWFYVMGNPSAVDIKFQFLEGSKLSFEYSYKYNATYHRFLRPQYVWNELVSRASDGEYSGEDCPYFGDLQHIDKVFSSGDGIRNIENPKFKISLAQFFDFFDTIDAVGIREKNKKVLLDRKKVLTDFVNIIDLGEIARPKTSFEKTFPFNELAVGYPDAKNESGMINGKNEVNTTFVFSTGTSKTPRKYDKISPVKVSCYEFENLRIEGFYKKTTDNKNDNEPFCLHINKELIPGSGSIPDHYELNRSYNAFVTGVDQAASVFNLELSPKNCINRSGDFLRSSGFKWDNRILKFISADRNAAMAYLNGANVIVENADITVAELADPFFNTLQITVETDAPEDLQDDLDENPGAVMQFSFEGDVYKILPLEIGNNPKTNKKQTYTGLSVPENDEKKLIDYYG